MAKTPIGEAILKNVRLSFVSLFEPNTKGNLKKEDGSPADPKYKCNALLEKGTEQTRAQMKQLKAVADEVKKDKWRDKIPKLKPEKVFLRDGDAEDWDGYADHFYISANNSNQPVLVDRVKDAKGKWVELTKANGGPKKLYSGAYANIIIRIWAQDDVKYGKRLNASIESVQFLRHGEPFSGGAPVDPNEKFDDIEDDDGDDISGMGGGDDIDSLI